MPTPALQILLQHIQQVPDGERSVYEQALLRELSELPGPTPAGWANAPSGMPATRDFGVATWVGVGGEPDVGKMLCNRPNCPKRRS